MSLSALTFHTPRQDIIPTLMSYRETWSSGSVYFHNDTVRSPTNGKLYLLTGNAFASVIDPAVDVTGVWTGYDPATLVPQAGTITAVFAAGLVNLVFGGVLAGNCLDPGAVYLLSFNLAVNGAAGVSEPVDIRITAAANGTFGTFLNTVLAIQPAVGGAVTSVTGLIGASSLQSLVGTIEIPNPTAFLGYSFDAVTLVRIA